MKDRLWTLARAVLPALIFVSSGAQAAPSISGTSGTWSHGGSVAVSGSAFGSKSTAAPLVWDDASGASITDKWDGYWPTCDAAVNTGYRSTQRSVAMPHARVSKYIAGIPDFDPEAASYVFTPQNVVTNVGFGQPNTQASYSFTPQNITTKPAFGQTSDQASYAFTPQNIATSLIRSFITTADVGSYSFSPQDTTTRQSVTVEPVDQASYAFSPQDIATNTIKAYVMAADQAGYTLTPQNVLTVAFLSRILAIGYALYSFTPYGVAIPGEVTPGNAVRRRNNRALAARLWRNKQELARKLFGV